MQLHLKCAQIMRADGFESHVSFYCKKTLKNLKDFVSFRFEAPVTSCGLHIYL